MTRLEIEGQDMQPQTALTDPIYFSSSVAKSKTMQSSDESSESVVEKKPTALVNSISQLSQRNDIEAQASAVPEKETRDPNLVDWVGPDDPENPFNWTTSRKARLLVIMAFNTFLT
jgi:hypothetical protein